MTTPEPRPASSHAAASLAAAAEADRLARTGQGATLAAWLEREPTALDDEALEKAATTLARAGDVRHARVIVENRLHRPVSRATLWVLGADLAAMTGDVARCAELMQQGVHRAPVVAALRVNLIASLVMSGRLEAACQAGEEAIRAFPEDWGVVLAASDALWRSGAHQRADGLVLEYADRHPDHWPALQQSLMGRLRDPDATPMSVTEAHRRVGALIEANVRAMPEPLRDADPERRLRVGYLSQDFRNRSAGHFIEPLIAHHDRSRFHVTCYHHTLGEDELTHRLIKAADAWHRIESLDDSAAAALIRSHQIDVLIDLTGHTGSNRVAVLAARPAPVQGTYLGYPATTGLTRVDFRIVDAITDPPGSEAHCTESLERVEGFFLAYQPPAHLPALADFARVPPAGSSPSNAGRPLTFGSFNSIVKINDRVLEVWGRVLRRCVGSRLVLKSHGLEQEMVRARVLRTLAAQGVEAARVECLGETSSPAAHLRLYERIDIALDPFPYNGTTTSVEALMMGVPLVTRRGTSHVSRVGESLLTRVGLSRLIASDDDGYVEAAATLADDDAARAEMRRSLRGSVLAAIGDGAAHTRRVEAIYRARWRRWCATRGRG